MMQPSAMQAGQYAPPTGPPSNPPTSQMAGISLGPSGYRPPAPGGGQPSFSYGGGGGPQVKPSPGGGAPFNPAMNSAGSSGPAMGNFPQRSSNYGGQPLGAFNSQQGPSNMPPIGGQQFPPPTSNLGVRPPMGPPSGPPNQGGFSNGPQTGGPSFGEPPHSSMSSSQLPPHGMPTSQPGMAPPGTVSSSSYPSSIPPSSSAGPATYPSIPGGYGGGVPGNLGSRPPTGAPPMGSQSISQPPGGGPLTGPPAMAVNPAMGGPSTGPPGPPTGPPTGHTGPPGPPVGGPPTSGGPPTGPGIMGPPGMMGGAPGTMGGGPPGTIGGGPPGTMGGGHPGMMGGGPPGGSMGGGPPGSMGGGPPGSMGGGPPGSMGGGPPGSMGGGPPGSMGGGPPGSMGGGPPGSISGGPPGSMGGGPPGSMSGGPPGSMGGGPPGSMGMGPPGMMGGGPLGSQPGPPGSQHGLPSGNFGGPPLMGGPSMNRPPGQSYPGPPGGSGGQFSAMPGMGPGGIRPGMPLTNTPYSNPVGGRPPGSPGLPHGPIQQQPKSKIDPDNMPNPVEVMKSDQEQRGGVPYSTSNRDMPPPLVTTDFTVVDDGNVSPRYLRATMYTVPCSKDILNSCKIPMGLVVQPYALVPQKEDTLQVVDCGPGGPIRCNRCKAYMSPFSRFVDGGRKYMCPVCQCSNEVPPEYFCHLDHTGRRTDVMQRPELRYGSVEFVANKDYCKEGKLPRPPAYIFMIDVSYGSIQTGILHLLSSTILGLLERLPGSSAEGGSPIKVGFVTYDRVLQFYNVKGSMAQPQMMVMTDVDDVFVPMTDGFLVNVEESRTVLESLLSQLPDMFSSNKTPQVVLEPVVRAGMEALKAAGRNGRLFVFHSSLPSAQSTGLLKNRLDSKLLGTDKEKTLLNPVSSPYQQLAEECVKYGVAVELFLMPTNYTDVATLGSFVSTTGGELHFYKNFSSGKDGDRLLDDLQRSLTRPTAFDCVMRVRASTGLRPTGFYGSFYMSNTTDIELGNIDSDKAIAVEIKHDDKLREDETAFFQAALLYTDLFGQRRLRIHNLALGCSTKFPDVYRSCEIDTIINFFSKSIVTASLTMAYKGIRESFSHQIAVILSCYRKNCSNQSPAGQLILPESLKLLPMYANCLLKSDALLSPPIVTLDEKCWLMRRLLSMPTKAAGTFIYPRMYSLHDLDLNAKGLPPLMRCTGQKLQEKGLYVIVDGILMVLWVGFLYPAESVKQLFGVPSLGQLDADELKALPALDNPLSFRVRGVVELLQSQQQCSMKLIVARQKDKSEIFFRRQLKEDKGAGQWEGTTYIDFLCQIHREIKEILS